MNELYGTSRKIPEALSSEVIKLIPYSKYSKLVCCVLHDGYPRDKKKIDAAVCLQGGIVAEFYARECISSLKLNISTFNEIQIIRNNEGELLYLVAADREVIILLSSEQLLEHRRFSDVEQYEICDPKHSGQSKLKITTASSTIYVSFADLNNGSQENNRILEDTYPVNSALEKKFVEAKYNLDRHEQVYKDIAKLRQHASFSCYGDDALQARISKPIVRFCNKKIVIELQVENPYDELMKNVCALIHNNVCNSISYTSKVFENLSSTPFYKENEYQEINSKCRASIVAVIPISEFKSSISSRIDFSVVASYERGGKAYLKSFDNVHISAGDVMGKNFDVFNSPNMDVRSMCLAMLSTTTKTTLCLKQRGLGDMISLSTIFTEYLGMDLLDNKKTVAVHKNSPHHLLHGIMIIFDDDREDIDNNEINNRIDVYVRSLSQVMALIHFIYDKVPLGLVITTPSIQVTSHGDPEDSDTQKDRHNNTHNPDYAECANSLLNQSTMTLEYLDKCLSEMNKSKSMDGSDIQIDLFAMGVEELVKYRNSMLAEAKNCFEYLEKSSTGTRDEQEKMDIDL